MMVMPPSVISSGSLDTSQSREFIGEEQQSSIIKSSIRESSDYQFTLGAEKESLSIELPRKNYSFKHPSFGGYIGDAEGKSP
jgi:hypothetical protein